VEGDEGRGAAVGDCLVELFDCKAVPKSDLPIIVEDEKQTELNY